MVPQLCAVPRLSVTSDVSQPIPTMRLIALCLLTLSCSFAAAGENPPYSCDGRAGCMVETSSPYDIGNGVLLELPEGWTLLAFPQPQISEVRLREIRAYKGEVVIAITPFPNLDRRVITEVWLRELLSKSAAQYVSQSREQVATINSLSSDPIVGGFYSFTSNSPSDKPFRVLPNRRYASVTTLMVSHKFIIFSVSVASEREPDDDYRAAVNAFRNLK